MIESRNSLAGHPSERRHEVPNPITIIGSRSTAGSYVLRIRVSRPLTIAFGRFKGGKKIDLQPGECLYVGSALAQKGATCLARRLVRHATRTGDLPPHAVRKDLVTAFQRQGRLGNQDLLPTKGKSLRWNVDHLLDQRSVELVAVYAIRSPLRLEGELGKLLANDPAAVIFEPGLGANDIKGNTHLFRVDAGEDWWIRLPSRLRTFLKQRIKLANMHRLRREAIECQMRAGMCYSAAESATLGVFDTIGWGEVISRSARARGIVCGIARLIAEGRVDGIQQDVAGTIRELAARIETEAEGLLRQLSSVIPEDRKSSHPAAERSSVPYRHVQRMGSNRALGQLRVACSFVAKCRRDAPLIEVNGGAALTEEQQAKIRHQIGGIRLSVSQLRATLHNGS